MNCGITGCPHTATVMRRGLSIKLPGHPNPVTGDVPMCPAHERATRSGAPTRINLSANVITAALNRRT